jgi:hypothetical protein
MGCIHRTIHSAKSLCALPRPARPIGGRHNEKLEDVDLGKPHCYPGETSLLALNVVFLILASHVLPLAHACMLII